MIVVIIEIIALAVVMVSGFHNQIVDLCATDTDWEDE